MEQPKEIISFGRIENRLMYPHCNPGMEIVLVAEGHLEWAVDGVPEVLDPGMVFFTLPWQAHGSLHLREPRNRICYVLFALEEPYERPSERVDMPAVWGLTPEEGRLVSDVLISARRHAWPASGLLTVLFKDLQTRLETDSPIASIGSRSLLRAIVIELVNIISQAPQSQQYNSPSRQRVQKFLDHLTQTLDHRWSLNEMAARCRMKRTRFATLVKQLTGYAPTQYFNRIRLQTACTLLRESQMSMTDIALECGYGSSQYFSESFRHNVRMSPSEYRRRCPELEDIRAVDWSRPEHRSIRQEKQRAAGFQSK